MADVASLVWRMLAFDDTPLPMVMFKCPHCELFVIVQDADIRCGIFRHAVFAGTYDLVPPHTAEAECLRLASRDEVIGCIRPFQIYLDAATDDDRSNVGARQPTSGLIARDVRDAIYRVRPCGYI